MYFKYFAAILIMLISCASAAMADTVVVEGDAAKQCLASEKGKAQTLVQKNKKFVLRAPNGDEKSSDTITVQAGQRFYISNEEGVFIHNVYDITDSSWVLKKQLPANVASITFNTPGKHVLRCAIHPGMEITVDVTPAAQAALGK